MRIEIKDKNMSFEIFKGMFTRLYVGYHPDLKEKALIREYEKATGKKYGKGERPAKKVKKSSKKLVELKE